MPSFTTHSTDNDLSASTHDEKVIFLPKPNTGKPTVPIANKTTPVKKPIAKPNIKPGSAKTNPVVPAAVVVATTKALGDNNQPTTTVNATTPVLVATWNLENTDQKAPESFEAFSSCVGGPLSIPPESVIGTDQRARVAGKDIAPGGKYRSIVKLFLYFGPKDRKRCQIATGWLIEPDLLVTAGHCVYDWSNNLGQVTAVKAYIGYNGKKSIGSPNVQFRKGTCVATTGSWMKSPNMHGDTSFIKLHKPFTGVKPFKYKDTPKNGNLGLGVVGYPGDLDKGEYMYEHFLQTQYDLSSGDGMIQYQIDTYGGNSGSPVLQKKDLASIGVHTYGGIYNKGTPIGPLGNSFTFFRKAIVASETGSKMAKTPLETSFLQFKPETVVAGTESGGEWDPFQADPKGESANFDDEEAAEDSPNESAAILEVFKRGFQFTNQFGNTLSSSGVPIRFGTLGRPISIYSHLALSRCGALVQRVESEGAWSNESELNGEETNSFYRAVLCEAALSAVIPLNEKVLDSQVFGHMKAEIKEGWPIFKKATKKLGIKFFTSIASSVVASSLVGNPDPNKGESGLDIDSNQEAAIIGEMLSYLAESARGIEVGHESLDNKSTFESAKLFLDESNNDEAAEDESEAEESDALTQGISARLLLGEAALNAVIKMEASEKQEGLFGSIVKFAGKIAVGALKNSAPGMLFSAAGAAWKAFSKKQEIGDVIDGENGMNGEDGENGEEGEDGEGGEGGEGDERANDSQDAGEATGSISQLSAEESFMKNFERFLNED